jgi:hypothetical protein
MKKEEFDGIKINKDAIAAGYKVWDVIVNNKTFTFATYKFIQECKAYGISLLDLYGNRLTSPFNTYCVLLGKKGPFIGTLPDAPEVCKLIINASKANKILKDAKERYLSDFEVKVIGY